jgi:paraquat-inducible protein A
MKKSLRIAPVGALARTREGTRASLALFVALTLFPLGLTLPAMHTTTLFLIEADYSILDFGVGLAKAGDWFLAAVILTFSVLFPALKLLMLARLHLTPTAKVTPKSLRRLEALGRWSMTDVMVLALAVFSIKASGLAEAAALPGAWFYAGSVIAAMIASSRITDLLHEAMDARGA